MSEAADITIQCPLCNGAILYPPEREGEEVPCPHCGDFIYLLSQIPPDPPPPPPALIAKEEPETKDPKAEQTITLHASTQQKIHSNTKRQATIKRTRSPGATPPNRKKISPPQSNVLKIPHIFPAAELERKGTKASPELILRHPVEFTLERTGGGLRKKADVWQCRWIAVHVQTDRQAKPWVTLLLEARVGNPTRCDHLRLQIGTQFFDLATDAAGDRDPQDAKTPAEGDLQIREQFSFEHDDFRYLCGQLALEESTTLQLDGLAEPVDEGTCTEFREYTLEFFEALRREFPIFFR